MSMHSRKHEPGLLTGGKDGVVIIWDGNLKIKNKISI